MNQADPARCTAGHLPTDPGPVDPGRQANQLVPGVDDLIEPGSEQIIRLRRLALLGSYANLCCQANHRLVGASIAKNEIARSGHLTAPNPVNPIMPPAQKSTLFQSLTGSSRATAYTSEASAEPYILSGRLIRGLKTGGRPMRAISSTIRGGARSRQRYAPLLEPVLPECEQGKAEHRPRPQA